MINIAINGFGRIGRSFLRAVLQDKEALKKIKVVVINVGSVNLDSVAHMFQYDSVMGKYSASVEMKDDILNIDGYSIKIIAELDPKHIEWGNFSTDWVVDASGKFTSRDKAQLHIASKAKNVLITAPAQDEDITIIPGVNDEEFDPRKHHIVSLGSCTTNAIVPIIKILHDAFKIHYGFMTTVHAYTNDQVLLDVEHKDLRRARAAAMNIIPTTTGASRVIDKILPELKGVVGGTAIRVPVAIVSLIDFSFSANEDLTPKKINEEFEKASRGALKGFVDVTYKPLVSSDYSGEGRSVVVDGLLTDAIGNIGKVFGWYDNEWGYSMRLKDFLMMVAER